MGCALLSMIYFVLPSQRVFGRGQMPQKIQNALHDIFNKMKIVFFQVLQQSLLSTFCQVFLFTAALSHFLMHITRFQEIETGQVLIYSFRTHYFSYVSSSNVIILNYIPCCHISLMIFPVHVYFFPHWQQSVSFNAFICGMCISLLISTKCDYIAIASDEENIISAFQRLH